MKRIIICGLVIVMAVFGTAGCADDSNAEDDAANNGGADATSDAEDDTANNGEADADASQEDVPAPPEPAIVGLSIGPRTVTVAEADDGGDTMSQVVIYIEDFSGTVTSAHAFVEAPTGDKNAPKQDFLTTGSQVQLINVPKRWFRGLEPGEYDIGAKIGTDAGESLTEWDLATVTIVE